MDGRQQGVEGENEPAKFSSTFQAILLSEGDDMETIVVPVPLPAAVVRLRDVGPSASERPSGAAAQTAVREQCFRRVASSDSVVRYQEQRRAADDSTDADSLLGGAEPRHCTGCSQRSEILFVLAVDANDSLTAATPAYCVDCYTSLHRSK